MRFLVLVFCCSSAFAQVRPVDFRVKLQMIQQELHPDFCWFHPRSTAIPKRGPERPGMILLTLQKHLKTSDHYSGLYFMRSFDEGKTWSKPVLPEQLDWRAESAEVDLAVCDVTPGWHAPSGKAIAIGVQVRYSKQGKQLLDRRGSHAFAYAVYDPDQNVWSPWKILSLPLKDDRFHLVTPGCVQWLTKSDGTVLVPVYVGHPSQQPFHSTVLQCRFDGDQLSYLSHGDELSLPIERGLYEPSLVRFQERYFLTLRNDLKGYVTTSHNGLHFQPVRPWIFDDRTDLGSYNTQQHWLAHSSGLFLAYTRKGANNDHIPRNRAPLFIAQVDPDSLQVLKATERVLIPERGVMLGNFGACAISSAESWVTDAEYYFGRQPHPRGADNSVFAARILWEEPNLTVEQRP